ncbi:MAG: methyltransferase domain-containing protein [Gaiellaceae bacterium]
MGTSATHEETREGHDEQVAAGHTSEGLRPALRSRMFARVWRMIDDSVDAQIRPAKADVLVDLPERLVEIGPGRGSNFSYYGDGTRVVAVEPNRLFHDDLRSSAHEHAVEVDVHGGDLSSARLPTASEDVVVSTLVLCSVPDADAELAEIRRVLRPGGRLVFIEHVAGEPGSATSVAQRVLRRPWRLMADGCDLCADTVDAIKNAGFVDVDAKRGRLGPAADPSSPMYWGVATR